ncbi:MAG: penicillin-binding protein 1C [Alcaligenaceae bacterium]|nr:penicillin-binding protein 1C [Alcaligenaceae bacterium]
MKAESAKTWWHRLVYGLLGLSLLIGSGLIAGRVALQYAAPTTLPGFNEIKTVSQSSYIDILDRQGQVLDRIRQDFTKRQGEWLTLDEISPTFIKSILHSEDKRFYQHAGVDWWALINAGQSHLRQKIKKILGLTSGREVGRGGASGISMQLASMLKPELQAKTFRSYRQKWQQMATALALERQLHKDEILEAYVNLLPFRGEIVGVSAAAETFYGKYAFGLNPRESALLAVMARAPNASITRLTERSCDLLMKMSEDNHCRGLEHFVSYYLSLPHPQRLDNQHNAPHLAQYARQWANLHDRKRVYTSLDMALQKRVTELVQQHLSELRDVMVQDAAVVVLDNSSGAILTYLGSSGGLSTAQEVDHARAPRQVASTLKPFLYAQMIDEKRLTAASLLHDSPINLLAGEGLYIPQNHNRSFAGWVSLRVALASSLNIPAVRTIVSLGVAPFYKKLKELHLPLSRDSEFYGYSLALGGADMDLLSLTNAYRTLANQGNYSSLWWNQAERTEPSMTEVFSPEAAWIIADILSDRQARAYTFGLDSVLTTPFWSAVKTGTSKDMRDNWTVGWSEHFTVGVWVGNSDGRSMQNVLGVSGAGPIWHDVMRYLHQNRESKAPPKPAAVVAETVQFIGLDEATRQEYFLTGTEMRQVVSLATSGYDAMAPIKIQAPINGSILALDPDIPLNAQKLYLKANIPPDDPRVESLQWEVSDIAAGRGVGNFWSPSRGRHRIVLKAEDGKVLDQVFISVR